MKRTAILCSSVLIILMMTGCKSKSPYENMRNKPIKVEIDVAGENFGDVSHAYVGEILAQSEIPLTFALGGEITSLPVKNGSTVTKGKVIAIVDNTQQANMLKSTKALLRQAEDGYERMKKVYEKGGISDVRWVEMQTDLSKAQNAHASAQKNYNDCFLKAPCSGVVNLQDVNVGQRLAPGQRIGSLLSMNGMRAEFTVPESQVGNIEIGQIIEVEVPAIERTLNATISEKSLVSSQMAHTYTIRADINADDSKDLLQGMVCKIKSENRDSSSTSIIVPSRSIQTQTNGLSVWVVKNGMAERRSITTSDFVKGGVVIASGIEAGDTIVTNGGHKLYNGAKVEF